MHICTLMAETTSELELPLMPSHMEDTALRIISGFTILLKDTHRVLGLNEQPSDGCLKNVSDTVMEYL